MPAPRSISFPNKITGTREIDGMRIKFEADFDARVETWLIRVTDHVGDQTRDFADTEDPMNLWGVIDELVAAAIETSRKAMAEIAGVAS